MNKIVSHTLKISLVITVIIICICCKKTRTSVNKTEEPEAKFDKQAMLVNIADNLIIPCYADFKISLDSLILSYNAFKTSGTQSDFKSVKQKLQVAYLKYQRVNLFGFGPGEDLGIRANFNVFPSSALLINSNINSGSYDLASLANIATKGFPALDYLFYGLNQTETERIQAFVSSNNCRKYVSYLLEEMSSKTNSALSTWKTSYRTTFINSLGTDVGSSIGFVVNQINYELDYLKNYKIGIPLGLKSGGATLPDNCEAYYGGQSLQYALETLSSIENIYLGRSFAGSDGKGIDDYLDHLGINYLDATLNTAIKNQLLLARAKLSIVANPLSEQVVSNSVTVNNAYKELVKLLVLLKTDMPSNLGVVITYQDGDGD